MRYFFKQCIVRLLTLEAQLVVRKYRPHVIAVTGSVGKTSTKDAIYATLTGARHVRKSEKSFNSEIGLPLTILGCTNAWRNPLHWAQNVVHGFMLILFPSSYPEWLVLEVGADRPGDIKRVAQWLPVDITVITRLPEVPVHVEFFDSPQEVVEEKASLIEAVKEGGAVVIYADDARLETLVTRAQRRHLAVVTFGFSAHADVRGGDVAVWRDEKSKEPLGMRLVIRANGREAAVSLAGAVGAHMLLPALAAAAVARVMDQEIEDIVSHLHAYQPAPGRMRLLPGIKGTLIIDDTYNSSPAATMAALDALALVAPRKRRIAVLGDMLELGRHSVAEHRKVGAYAAKKATMLLTVGFRARDIAEGALNNKMADDAILQYERAERAGEELAGMVKSGDCILVKGSQSMRMERAVERLMAEPARAEELLVRQEPEWKKR